MRYRNDVLLIIEGFMCLKILFLHNHSELTVLWKPLILQSFVTIETRIRSPMIRFRSLATVSQCPSGFTHERYKPPAILLRRHTTLPRLALYYWRVGTMHILYLQRELHFRGRNNILAMVVTSKGTF